MQVILVANKADLVRNRQVKAAGWLFYRIMDKTCKYLLSAGKSLAQKFNIKYIETSPGKYPHRI